MSQFQKYTFALLANQEINPSIQGNFLRMTGGLFPIVVTPSDITPVELQKGIGIDFGLSFTQVRIKNGANAQTIEIYAGSGVIYDNRLITQGGVSINGNSSATLGSATIGTTAIEVVPENEGRASLLLTNNSASIIYIGVESSVTVATGIPIGAGQSFTITFMSSVYGISDDTGLNVRFIEESN